MSTNIPNVNNEEKEKFGIADIILSKPIEWEGQTYDRLKLDFNGLTGSDMEAVDDEAAAMNKLVSIPYASRFYMRLLAAKAAKVPSDMIAKLPLSDYNAVISATRRFLQITG